MRDSSLKVRLLSDWWKYSLFSAYFICIQRPLAPLSVIFYFSPHLTIEYESDEEQYSSTETLNESELQDLIESEAIALTEDAIFLAKREIYRELFNISDLSISQIAQSLVDETISEVLKDLYYPDVHRGGQDSTDDGEQEPSLVPFDYDVRAHDPQRLDSIQEESETSDNSINVRIISFRPHLWSGPPGFWLIFSIFSQAIQTKTCQNT